MATVALCAEATPSINSPSANNGSRPKPILKSSIAGLPSTRFDRAGTAIQGKEHRITFVDRVLKNVPIHTIIEVEAIEYSEPSPRQKGCTCSLL